MKWRVHFVGAAAAAMVLTLAPAAQAHNRALIFLPNGDCVQVGSLTSVSLPDVSAAPSNVDGLLDLRPETQPADEIGAAFAADEGNSALEKGACP
jgi:hypothetical protein